MLLQVPDGHLFIQELFDLLFAVTDILHGVVELQASDDADSLLAMTNFFEATMNLPVFILFRSVSEVVQDSLTIGCDGSCQVPDVFMQLAVAVGLLTRVGVYWADLRVFHSRNALGKIKGLAVPANGLRVAKHSHLRLKGNQFPNTFSSAGVILIDDNIRPAIKQFLKRLNDCDLLAVSLDEYPSFRVHHVKNGQALQFFRHVPDGLNTRSHLRVTCQLVFAIVARCKDRLYLAGLLKNNNKISVVVFTLWNPRIITLTAKAIEPISLISLVTPSALSAIHSSVWVYDLDEDRKYARCRVYIYIASFAPIVFDVHAVISFSIA